MRICYGLYTRRLYLCGSQERVPLQRNFIVPCCRLSGRTRFHKLRMSVQVRPARPRKKDYELIFTLLLFYTLPSIKQPHTEHPVCGCLTISRIFDLLRCNASHPMWWLLQLVLIRTISLGLRALSGSRTVFKEEAAYGGFQRFRKNRIPKVPGPQ